MAAWAFAQEVSLQGLALAPALGKGGGPGCGDHGAFLRQPGSSSHCLCALSIGPGGGVVAVPKGWGPLRGSHFSLDGQVRLCHTETQQLRWEEGNQDLVMSKGFIEFSMHFTQFDVSVLTVFSCVLRVT